MIPLTSLGAGIIPAYAGSTPPSSLRIRNMRDHPRIRGEHLDRDVSGSHCEGSSPHTRGAPGVLRVAHFSIRIIPAYAGSTEGVLDSAAQGADHPRIRGEHDSMTSSAIRAFGSSPHTRGAHELPNNVVGLDGIIPAYAGSTPHRGLEFGREGDHPRIRGEHRAFMPSWRRGDGSSPHTRGALIIFRSIAAFEGIIPAYAGSTNGLVVFSLDPQDHPRIRGEHTWKSLQYQGSPS